MKKIILVLLVLFTSFSCSKDEEPQITESDIIGKWFYVSEKFNGEENVFTDCDKQQYYQFTPGGTFNWHELDQPPCEFSDVTAEYTISGDVLEIWSELNPNEPVFSFNIIRLNETALILKTSTELTENYVIELRKQ